MNDNDSSGMNRLEEESGNCKEEYEKQIGFMDHCWCGSGRWGNNRMARLAKSPKHE